MNKRIIRVFPRKTSYTPEDDYVFIGMPPFIIPEHDEVHVSCTFTWDKAECEELAYQWEGRTNKPVKLGGVAFGNEVEGFEQGLYVKSNIIFTSRGCNNHDMLRHQKQICFKGGLESELIDDHFIDGVTSLRIKELWLACDYDATIPKMQKAVAKLTKAGFNRNKIFCYCLSYGKDMEKDEARARAIWDAGAMPFVQLFRDYSDTKTEYSADWNRWQRMLSRPALTRAHFEKGTDFRDCNLGGRRDESTSTI